MWSVDTTWRHQSGEGSFRLYLFEISWWLASCSQHKAGAKCSFLDPSHLWPNFVYPNRIRRYNLRCLDWWANVVATKSSPCVLPAASESPTCAPCFIDGVREASFPMFYRSFPFQTTNCTKIIHYCMIDVHWYSSFEVMSIQCIRCYEMLWGLCTRRVLSIRTALFVVKDLGGSITRSWRATSIARSRSATTRSSSMACSARILTHFSSATLYESQMLVQILPPDHGKMMVMPVPRAKIKWTMNAPRILCGRRICIVSRRALTLV